MKNLILTTLFIFIVIGSNAQETFFPVKEGIVLLYKTFDKKEKVASMMRYTVKQVRTEGSNLEITYLCESYDAKEKPLFKEEITIHQKGDKLYFDMSNFINKAAFQQNGEIPAEVQITGNEMEIPVNPAPGDVIPDARVEMALKMGFVNMKMSADLTNRKVEGIEDITVKEGTFKCYKFSSDVNASAMGLKTKMRSLDWYAKGIGVVKTESYDKNNTLVSHTELCEIIN